MLSCFTEFSFDDLVMDEQGFEDYKSKYFDLYDKVRTDRQKEKVSILEDIDGLQKVIGNYLFTGKIPLRSEIIAIMQTRPKLRDRSTVTECIIEKIKAFVETFIDGVD